jgi:hypothetical protein
MEFTFDTKLGDILDNKQAKAILDKHLPGLATNPMFAMAKGMSFNNILALPQAKQLGLDKTKIESLLAELNKFIP